MLQKWDCDGIIPTCGNFQYGLINHVVNTSNVFKLKANLLSPEINRLLQPIFPILPMKNLLMISGQPWPCLFSYEFISFFVGFLLNFGGNSFSCSGGMAKKHPLPKEQNPLLCLHID